MGKQSDNNSRSKNEPDDYELKVLIDKCNVCQSNLDTDHHKVCKLHGERQMHRSELFQSMQKLSPLFSQTKSSQIITKE